MVVLTLCDLQTSDRMSGAYVFYAFETAVRITCLVPVLSLPACLYEMSNHSSYPRLGTWVRRATHFISEAYNLP
jgi:hypothetical protein